MTSTNGLEGVVATQSASVQLLMTLLHTLAMILTILQIMQVLKKLFIFFGINDCQKRTSLLNLKQQLADNMAVPQEVFNHFKTYPIDKVHPMAALRTAVSLSRII